MGVEGRGLMENRERHSETSDEEHVNHSPTSTTDSINTFGADISTGDNTVCHNTVCVVFTFTTLSHKVK